MLVKMDAANAGGDSGVNKFYETTPDTANSTIMITVEKETSNWALFSNLDIPGGAYDSWVSITIKGTTYTPRDLPWVKVGHNYGGYACYVAMMDEYPLSAGDTIVLTAVRTEVGLGAIIGNQPAS